MASWLWRRQPGPPAPWVSTFAPWLALRGPGPCHLEPGNAEAFRNCHLVPPTRILGGCMCRPRPAGKAWVSGSHAAGRGHPNAQQSGLMFGWEARLWAVFPSMASSRPTRVTCHGGPVVVVAVFFFCNAGGGKQAGASHVPRSSRRTGGQAGPGERAGNGSRLWNTEVLVFCSASLMLLFPQFGDLVLFHFRFFFNAFIYFLKKKERMEALLDARPSVGVFLIALS